MFYVFPIFLLSSRRNIFFNETTRHFKSKTGCLVSLFLSLPLSSSLWSLDFHVSFHILIKSLFHFWSYHRSHAVGNDRSSLVFRFSQSDNSWQPILRLWHLKKKNKRRISLRERPNSLLGHILIEASRQGAADRFYVSAGRHSVHTR